jgi:restriction endonuclease S subunit
MISFSIIQKSQLEGGHRLDAEYYQPEYLDVEKRLQQIETKSLDELAKTIVSFGAYSLTSYIEWQDEGVAYINVGDIHDGHIDYSGIKHISEKVDAILQKSRVKEGQVLLTMAGTIGNAAVVDQLSGKANANQAIAKITPIDDVSPYFLVAFLNSRYGRLQTEREIVSSVQANIFLGPIKKFRIPVFSKSEQTGVESLYREFLESLNQSGKLYSQAEDLLLGELGLKDAKFGEDLVYAVKFSDIKNAERMDADYFQPKYEKVMKQIMAHDGRPLDGIVSVKKGIEPGAEAYQDEGVLFIRVSSISRQGITDKDQKYLNEKLYKELRENYQPRAGEILLTKDASPGMAYALKEPVEGIVSGGVLRLKLKEDIDPEYIALCINSHVGQMQVDRDAGGSIISHWKPEQVKNMLIPILPKPIQQKIADLVRQSHEARTKSKELLESAKHKVEELIEKRSTMQ